jgi:hypothetical protein
MIGAVEGLTLVGVLVAAAATTDYALTTRRMKIDAISPALAISVGNVPWPPRSSKARGSMHGEPPPTVSSGSVIQFNDDAEYF